MPFSAFNICSIFLGILFNNYAFSAILNFFVAVVLFSALKIFTAIMPN